jgi:zinc/manganese transport system permease protein
MNEILFILPALTVCFVLIGIHTYLGLHVIAREVIFLDIALAQIAALGLTIALLCGFEPSSQMAYIFALGMTFLAAILFTLIKSKSVPLEAIIGVSFVVSSAIGILLADKIPHGAEHLKHILSGNILWVTWPQIAKTALIYGTLGSLHYLWRKKLLLVSKHPTEAKKQNLRTWVWDLFFYISFGIVITSSVQIAGILMVFSFLIIPALCSMLLFSDMKRQLLFGWAIGSLASIIGLGTSLFLDLPSGPAIVTILGSMLMLTFACRRVLKEVEDGGAR